MSVLEELEERKDHRASLSRIISSYHLQELLVTNRTESARVNSSIHIGVTVFNLGLSGPACTHRLPVTQVFAMDERK